MLLLVLGPGKRYCKKVSAKRLLVNNDCAANHKIWNSYGLKLADCDGAVKRCFIDLETPNTTVESDLGKTFHAPETLEDAKRLLNLENIISANTCASRNGTCSSARFAALVKKCVTDFAKHTSDNHLQAGTLVKIVPSGLPDLNPIAHAYFLGSCCKKPLAQVLMKADASADDDKLYRLFPESEQFMSGFSTTHQVFQMLLLEHCQNHEPAEVEQVDFLVEVFACGFPNHFSNVQKLEVYVLGTATNFKICCGKRARDPRPQARPVKLPFGLQLAKPSKRKKTHGSRIAQKKKKSEPASNETSDGIDGTDGALDESSADSEQDQDDPEDPSEGASKTNSGSDSDNGSSHASTLSSSEDSSSSSTSSSSSMSGTRDVGGLGDWALSETLMPPTTVALAEEKIVEEENQAFQEAQAAQVKAAAVPQGEPAPKPKPKPRGTYFVTSVRFDGGSIAPSSRSVCYHCNGKIEQDSVRFAYFYNPRKPSRYIHQRCVVPFVMADLTGACKDQAVHGMMDIISEVPEVASPVKLAAQQVLAQILSNPG